MKQEHLSEADRAIAQADRIASAAARAIRVKYIDGQIEHGGDLFRKPVLREALAEVTDLFSYLHVLEHQHAAALALLDQALDCANLPPEIRAARNLLRHGNVEGEAG